MRVKQTIGQTDWWRRNRKTRATEQNEKNRTRRVKTRMRTNTTVALWLNVFRLSIYGEREKSEESERVSTLDTIFYSVRLRAPLDIVHASTPNDKKSNVMNVMVIDWLVLQSIKMKTNSAYLRLSFLFSFSSGCWFFPSTLSSFCHSCRNLCAMVHIKIYWYILAYCVCVCRKREHLASTRKKSASFCANRKATKRNMYMYQTKEICQKIKYLYFERNIFRVTIG